MTSHRNGAPASLSAAAFAWCGALLFVISLAYFVYCYAVAFGRAAAPGPAAVPVALDVALFSAFAFHHSVFARSRFKAWVRSVAGVALERPVYTWIASLLFIGVCALWRPVPGEIYRLDGVWRWAGLAAQAAGLALTVAGARALDAFDLAGVRPWLSSRGTARLVTSGVFRIVRHPLYFGWALFVFGEPHMNATRFVFATVSTVYLAIAIPWEERGLVATFGAEYEGYRRLVRSRMLPGIY